LTAFSDGVIAILITVMVLELKVPEGAAFGALRADGPVLLAYLLSFIYLGIYWNNHHHFFHLVPHVNGAVLWANLHLLFWLSLVPFVTEWVGRNFFAPAPTAIYGVVLLMAAVAWTIMQTVVLRSQEPNSALARALGRDWKGKTSLVLYVAGILLTFVHPALAYGLYALVAALWLVPDRRIERTAR
jgi:uncharacterized membrane protein